MIVDTIVDDDELVNERDLSKKKYAVDLFDNTSMASGITLDSTFSNLLKDLIFVMCVGDVTVSIHLGLYFQFALY